MFAVPFKANADREFERPPIASESGEAIDGRSEYLGGEHSGAGGVVAPGGVLIPDFVLSHEDDRVNGGSPASNG